MIVQSIGDVAAPAAHEEVPRASRLNAIAQWRGRAAVWLAVAFLALVFVVLYGPLLLLIVFSFNDSIIIALPFRGVTLRWYEQAFGNPRLLESLRNSILIAALVTPVCLLLGTLASFGLMRFRYRLRGAVAGLLGAPLIVPWLLIGVGALLFFNRLSLPLSLQTVTAMHVVCTFPLVAAIMSAQLARFDRSQEEAALDLGARPWEVLRYILLPQLAPALAASAIFAFSWSFNNFEVSFFTSGFELTFPLWVFSTLRHAQNLPVVNAISTVVSIAQVLAVLVAWRLATRSRDQRRQGERRS